MQKCISIFILFAISGFINAQQLSNPNLDYFNSLPIEIQNQILSNQNKIQGAESDTNNIRNQYLLDQYELQAGLKDLKKRDLDLTNQVFGFDFFLNEKIEIDPILDIPAQSDYLISVNDEIEVLFTGSFERLITTRVDMGGSITIPELGFLSVVNLTSDVATKKIQALVSSKYVGTEAYLSIKKPSLKKISIIGAVNTPGTYLVNPFASISSAITYADGLSKNASLRTIEVTDYKGEKNTYDLYNFLIYGNKSADKSLNNGDTINIATTNNFINIRGEINRPMQYEYIGSDDISDLIDMSQGFTNDANKNLITINKLSNRSLVTETMGLNDKLGNNVYTELFVGSLERTSRKKLLVDGGAVTGGYYDFSENERLDEIFKKIKFSENIFPFFSLLKQTSNNGLFEELATFSIADPESYAGIKLKQNPEIYFFSKDEILAISSLLAEEKENISLENLPENLVLGTIKEDELNNIANPGVKKALDIIPSSAFKVVISGEKLHMIPLTGRVIPKSLYLNLGLKDRINERLVSASFKTLETQTNIYEFPLDADEISLLSMPSLSNQNIKVSISGQVIAPGDYFVTPETSLNDLYKIAGGFTPVASEDGIVFSRESVKQREELAFNGAKKLLIDAFIQRTSNPLSDANQSFDISGILAIMENVDFVGRIAGNLRPNTEFSTSLTLEDGDSIYVPSLPTTVTIIGEVLNPTTINFSGNTSYDKYITLAGGFTKYADKDSAYIIKQSGDSYKLNSGYFRKEVYVNPGDTIVIPRDTEKISRIPLIGISTKIISDIAFAAASINSLSNN